MPKPASQTSATSRADIDVARSIVAGDRTALEALMRQHNRALYRTVRSIIKDDAEAEDALQETYLLAYRSMEKYRGDAALLTWLTRIAINEAIARSRKSARRAELIHLHADTALERDNREDDMPDTTVPRPDIAVMRSETRQLLERHIDALPDAFRTVFVLRAVEEMSVEETATCLAIPEATVRTRFFRARAMLREALAREIDFAMEDAFSFDGARCDRIVAGVLARLQ
jgi:RNA polymerase sigma-70 factor (ECF subfamily)